jgi:pimeloyl-ACP methyl ester carboxylesterase
MPYLNLPGAVSLFYELLPALEAPHSERRNALDIPPSPSTPSSTSSRKPTLIILSPLLCDITSRSPQAVDLRLRTRFNIVCLDLRSQGRTKSEIRPTYDHCVAATDIANAMEALRLPPAFLFAPGFIAFRVAVNFALLFPQQVVGLAFAGICGMFGTPSALDSFE